MGFAANQIIVSITVGDLKTAESVVSDLRWHHCILMRRFYCDDLTMTSDFNSG
jgi:hypothetical protein